MAPLRAYVKEAILSAMKDHDWVYAHQLVDEVSRLIGKPISSQGVARHLMGLRGEGKVESRLHRLTQRLYKWRLRK